MELLLFLADTLALFILVFTSLRNDRARSGEPLTGPFRYDTEPLPESAPETKRNARNRVGRS